jgi:hypothetical protein
MLADRSEAEMGGSDGLTTGMRRFAAWKSSGDRQAMGTERLMLYRPNPLLALGLGATSRLPVAADLLRCSNPPWNFWTYIPQVRNFLKFSFISGFRGSSGESDASPESRRENRLGGTESISRDGQSDLRPLSAMVGWAISAF